MSDKVKTAIITGIFSLAVGIIGTLGVGSITSNTQTVKVYVNGTEISVSPDEYQAMYDELALKYSMIEADYNALKEQVTPVNGMQSNIQYINETPVSDAQRNLTAYEPINSNYWSPNKGTMTDAFGVLYTNSVQYVITGYNKDARYSKPYNLDNCYVEVCIDGEYSKLRGKIVAHEKMTENGSGSIRILVDKGITGQWEEVYPNSVMKVTRNTEPFQINVDLGEQVKNVRIEGHGDSLMLLDFAFYND